MNGTSKFYDNKFNQGEGKKNIRKRSHNDIKGFKIPDKKSKVMALSDKNNNREAAPVFKHTGGATLGVDQGSCPGTGNGKFPPQHLNRQNGSDREKVYKEGQGENLTSNEYFSN